MTSEQRETMAHVLLQFYDCRDVAFLTDDRLREEYQLMCDRGENPTLRPKKAQP